MKSLRQLYRSGTMNISRAIGTAVYWDMKTDFWWYVECTCGVGRAVDGPVTTQRCENCGVDIELAWGLLVMG